MENRRDLSTFKKAINDMIATNDSAYQNKSYGNIRVSNPTKNYSEEEIKRILKEGNQTSLQQLSQSYFRSSGFYKRIILYYATLLKYTGILIPHLSGDKKITEPKNKKRYYSALDFIERVDLPILCANIAVRAMVSGAYYGIIIASDKTTFAILDLPADFCCTRFKDYAGNDIIEFDLSYFNKITRKEDRDAALAAYPKEISKAYLKWSKKKEGSSWFLIPSDIGICIPFFDGAPPFISSISNIDNYEDYLDIEKARDEQETKRILVQQIPHLNDGTLLFEPDEAAEMHAGTVNMLKGNKNFSVLTTYGVVDLKNSQTTTEAASKSNLEKIVNTIYQDVGVSQELFASTGNLTLDRSIKNDISFMMNFANKISKVFSNIINNLYSNNVISFKYKILPISYYNEENYINNTHKLASSGYSFMLPALAADLSQREIVDIKVLENDLLKMRDKLIPLSTSYTETNNNNEGGAPQKPEEEKSDKTIQNEESMDNNGG